uniref:CRAL-TRIO domain-containing protein n=1 Tax=Romanomermis culicivorax TaxID=13658 RepID=A0A915ITL0_ROMCU
MHFQVCRNYYGYGYPCCDKEGDPILLSAFGPLDVEGLVKSISSYDYIRTSLKHLEEGMILAKQSAEKKGEPYSQLTMVVDLNNLNTSHYTYKPFTYSYLTLLAIFQENYPLAFKKILVIQAPSVAQYAYTLLQPVLSEHLQNMIEIPGGWEERLFELVDKKDWPAFWGGEGKDPNGDEKCPSKVVYNEGPIPESYYADDKMEDKEALTVYAGDKRLLDFEVHTPNTQL